MRFRFHPHGVPLSEHLTSYMEDRLGRLYNDFAFITEGEVYLEEVFGEIQDEHDRAEPFLKEEAPGTYLVEGRWEIEAINKKLGLALPSENAVTLSGLIVETLGRIPRPGETWEAFGLAWTILQATRQRIQTVKIRVL